MYTETYENPVGQTAQQVSAEVEMAQAGGRGAHVRQVGQLVVAQVD